MPNIKINELPAAASASLTAVLPADNAGLTQTEKVTVAQIVAQAPVQSVAGKTGAVTLAGSDITTGTVSDTRLSSNAQSAINLYLWSQFR